MPVKKLILILFLLFLTFLYGLVVGRYKVFPYNQLTELRNWITGQPSSGTNPEDTQVINTALARLLVKRIQIDEDYRRDLYVRGGAIASRDQFLYLNTNRNDELKNQLVVFDTRLFERVETGGLAVPMNLDSLLESPIMDIEGFRLDSFRINGLYVEKTGDMEHTLYVSHTYYHPSEKCISSNVSKVTLETGNLSISQSGEWQGIFQSEPCLYPEEDKDAYEPFSGQMSGGPMIAYDDEHILVSIGNFHRDGVKYDAYPMDATNPYGKIIRLHKNSGEYSIYAKGIRNSQGLFRDAQGRIWATDHGPQGGDELNLIEEGDNLGWPEVSYGIDYGNKPWPRSGIQGRHDEFDQPVYVWIPSIAVTNITGIQGRGKFSLWAGDLLIGSLTNHSIHRLRIQDGDRIIYSESIRIGKRIRDLTSLEDGSVALISDDGLLIIVDDGGPVYEPMDELVEAKIAQLENFNGLDGNSNPEINPLHLAESIFYKNVHPATMWSQLMQQVRIFKISSAGEWAVSRTSITPIAYRDMTDCGHLN
jgi:hypothetical protein